MIYTAAAIALLSKAEIDRLTRETDITYAKIFYALREHFYESPNKTRARKWEVVYRKNGFLFNLLTDDDIAALNEIKGGY